jgi:hypothetical protein
MLLAVIIIKVIVVQVLQKKVDSIDDELIHKSKNKIFFFIC